MKSGVAWLLAGVGLMTLGGCREKKPVVTVTEIRPLTTRDRSPKLAATSDERFRNAKPSPVQGDAPAGWTALPAEEFRLLNYRFGEGGAGEVWVSLSNGTVLANVNRWLKQFQAPDLDEAGLAKLPQVKIAGTTGAWVTAEGDYEGGVSKPPATGYGLAGVVAAFNGQILTVKMVGPAAMVAAAKPQLEAFAASLRMAE
jgi:hypothetical protein